MSLELIYTMQLEQTGCIYNLSLKKSTFSIYVESMCETMQ